MKPAAAMYGTPDEGSATRPILERAMSEAKRIRLEALATAEHSHRALTEATRLKCDEMLAAAHEEAAAIVDGARREAQRLRAQAAVETPIPLAKGNQTSAHMVLEMAFEEAEQMVAKAAEDAERVRESMLADAHASAMEILRSAEIESTDRLREARQRLDILREQTKQFYDRLCDVTGEFADRQANADALRYAPSPEAELIAAGSADSMEAEPSDILQKEPDTLLSDAELATIFADETPHLNAAMEDGQEPVSATDLAETTKSACLSEMEPPTAAEVGADKAGLPEETATADSPSMTAVDAPAEAEDADDRAAVAQVEERAAVATTAEENAEPSSEPEGPTAEEAVVSAVGTSLARWKPDHRVALTRYVPAAYVWQATGPAAATETAQPDGLGPEPEMPSTPTLPSSAGAQNESYEEVTRAAHAFYASQSEPDYTAAAPAGDDPDPQPQPTGLLAQRLSVQGDERERLRSESSDRIFGLQARLRDSLAANANSGEHGGFRRFLNR